jgi:thiol-disulfide isomerase/thioredoxin
MTLSLRLAALPVLGLSLIVAAGGLALAAGDKPAKPPAGKPPATGKEAAAAPATYADIESAFQDKEKEARKALRAQRIDAIVAYLAKNATAKDAEPARKALVDLAEELEDWTRTVTFSDEYVKAHGDAANVVEVNLSRAQALAALGKNSEAKSGFAEIVKVLDLQKHGRLLLSVWTSYAELLIDMDDLAGAKKVWTDAKELIPQAEEPADAQIMLIELIGKEPTPFADSAKDLDGKPVALGDYKDKIVLIDFWATWCPPCREEIPGIVAAYGKYHDKGFDVVGVTLDRANQADTVRAYTTTAKMPWRQIYYADGENQVAQDYNVTGIPHTVLVGRDGKILRVGLRGNALGKTLAKLFAASAEKPAEKPAGK